MTKATLRIGIGGYDEPELDRFAAMARKWQAAGHDGYIFMIQNVTVTTETRRTLVSMPNYRH